MTRIVEDTRATGTDVAMERAVRGIRNAARLVALALGILAANAHAAPRDLTWVAGQTSGGWYVQAVGFANLVKARDPDLTIHAVPGAAYGNMTKLELGQADLAWSLPPVITAAYAGSAPYTAPQSDLRLVMTGLGFVDSQFCVAADSPIHSIRELFEQKMVARIGSPKPGGSDEWELRKIFEFYKSSYKELEARGGKLVFGSFGELAQQYVAGTIDAFILNNALPATDVEKASRARKMRILPMDDDLLTYLAQFGLVSTVIAKGSYPDVVNNDVDIRTAAMANTIMTSARLPDDVIHDFTKLLLDNLAAVRAIHPAFADFNPADAMKLANVPLHPGAARAFREAGLLH